LNDGEPDGGVPVERTAAAVHHGDGVGLLSCSHVRNYHVRLLSDEYDPRDLMQPFPAEPMRMWPISTRVNKPENDDPSIVEPIELSAA
jgi:hypothetical protein